MKDSKKLEKSKVFES